MRTYGITALILEYVETGDMVELAYLLEKAEKEELADIISSIITTLLSARSPMERNKLREAVLAVGTDEEIEQFEFELETE